MRTLKRYLSDLATLAPITSSSSPEFSSDLRVRRRYPGERVFLVSCSTRLGSSCEEDSSCCSL